MDPLQTMSPEIDNGQTLTPEVPQAAAPETQVPAQSQSSIPAQVENGTQPTSQEAPRASEFETARQIKNLTKMMRSMQQAFERSSQSAQPQGTPQVPQARPTVTPQELVADPLGVIQRMLSEQKQELLGMIPQTITKREEDIRHTRDIQEGWKVIKSSDAFKRDPEGEERINEILTEEDENGNSLQKYSIANPLHAAKLALAEYTQRYGNRKPAGALAPTKQQMASTATASYPGGGKVDVNQESLKLQREAMDNPDLMKDPGWLARLETVKRQFNQAKFGTPNPVA